MFTRQNPSDITNTMTLSNSSLQGRADEMSEDVGKQLISHLKAQKFTFGLHECTLRDSEAFLLAYERFLDIQEPGEATYFALQHAKKRQTTLKGVLTYLRASSASLET